MSNYDYNDIDYGYDEMYGRNPLMSDEAIEFARLGNAIGTGTAYERFGYDPTGREEAKREEKYLEYKPGIHTRSFTGTSKGVERAVNKFHKQMYEKYSTYEVKNTASTQLTTGTCLYLTFQV